MKASKIVWNDLSQIKLEEDLQDYFSSADPLTSADLDELECAGKELESDPEFITSFYKSFFVEKVLEAMEEEGLTQSELASRLDKSRQYLHGILIQNRKVNFTIDTMVRISQALGRRFYINMLSQGEAAHVVRIVSRPERFRTVQEIVAARNAAKIEPLSKHFTKTSKVSGLKAGVDDDRTRVWAA